MAVRPIITDLENKILELGPENVACFIAEPLLASGGVIVPPPGYQKRTWEICRKAARIADGSSRGSVSPPDERSGAPGPTPGSAAGSPPARG